MTDINCRLAKLEQWKDGHDDFSEKMFNKLSLIESRLDNQKGFIAGITFAVSAIITLVGLAIGWFHK